MRLGLGLGLGAGFSKTQAPPAPVIFDFTSSMPSAFTFARTSGGQYRDSTGTWQTAAAGVRRDHYVDDLSDHGTLSEPATVNKLTDRNANPTDATGWTKGGDAASTLTAVSDAGGRLSAAGLGVLCSSGKYLLLDNTSGTTAATMTSTATFGATTQHIISAWLYVISGTATITRTGAGTPETLAVAANSGFVRMALFATPNATTDQMQISISPGGRVGYILGQIEANTFYDYFDNGTSYLPTIPKPSTPIITNAATTLRQADGSVSTDPALMALLNTGACTIVCEYIPLGYSITQVLFCASHDTTTSGATASFGLVRFKDTPAGFPSMYFGNNTNISLTPQAGMPTIGRYNRIAIQWDSSNFTLAAPVIYAGSTSTAFALQPMARLRIGGHANGGNVFNGIIKKIKVYSYNTGNAVGADIFNPGDRIMFRTGQSLSSTQFQSVESNTNPGELRTLQVMNQFYPPTLTSHNYAVNGAYYGSSLLKSENIDGINWWLDDGGVAAGFVSWGPRATRAFAMLQALKAANVPASRIVIVWNQENGGLSASTTDPVNRWREALVRLKARFDAIYGANLQFQAEFESGHSPGVLVQDIRDIYYALAASGEIPNFQLGPEVIDAPLFDTVHWSDAGQYLQAPRTARKAVSTMGATVTGGTNGPRVVSVSRSGLTVTITVAHDGGTDFLASTAYGFYYFDNYPTNATPLFDGGTTTVTKTSSTTFTMTLPSIPTYGIENFMMNYAGDYLLPLNAMAKDNSPYGYLIRGCNVSVPFAS